MLKRVKRLIGYSEHARFLAQVAEGSPGVIPRQADIPSPYHYAPEWRVFRRIKPEQLVVIVETKHRQFDVFEVPQDMVRNPVLA